MQKQARNTASIKKASINFGFEYCGVARAQPLDEDARRLEKWLQKGMHGSMQYMENYFDLRIDPSKLVPSAKSVITVLKNYFPQHEGSTEPKISKYALGQDYHTVIKSALKSMIALLQQEIGQFNGRGFVDSAPVLERTWAERSGLGWIGKNGNLITKDSGSFFFIATLITDLELIYDDPFAKDYCGSCTRCIDTCPTEAILPDKVINGSKCIAYFTIELKDEIIPAEQKGKFRDWMFGCDICQDVCPWNRFQKPTEEMRFEPRPDNVSTDLNEILALSPEKYAEKFRRSAMKRTKLNGLKRNAAALKIKRHK